MIKIKFLPILPTTLFILLLSISIIILPIYLLNTPKFLWEESFEIFDVLRVFFYFTLRVHLATLTQTTSFSSLHIAYTTCRVKKKTTRKFSIDDLKIYLTVKLNSINTDRQVVVCKTSAFYLDVISACLK